MPRLRSVFVTLLGYWLTAAPPAHAQSFERVLDKPCRALALDKEPYWAALGDDAVTVADKRGVHEEPLPSALRGTGQEFGVYFGRDYRVRVAGTAHSARGDELRYYRWLPGGLRPATDELGPLGKGGAPGLVALLGTSDPEIVCRPGAGCLIKRVSGWGKASAPNGLERVGLSLGNAWAIAGSRLLRLGQDWVALPDGPWQKGDDGFVRGDEACVVERRANRLHHFDGSRWQSSPAPVAGPRSLWGTDDGLWVAGDGGVARFNDGAFQQLPGPARIAQVLGRNERDVWLCGAEGVFRRRAD
jgi:hypothetical protein